MATISGSSAKYIYGLCGATLIVMNLWSLAVLKRARAEAASEPPGIAVEALSELRQAQLPDGQQPLQDLGNHGSYALLVILTPFDCPTAIEELEQIQELHREEPGLDVRAVMSSVSTNEARQTEERFHLTFHVIADTDSRLRHLLRPPQTPWKLLYDTRTGHILMEDAPSITPEEKIAFHKRVTYVLRGVQNSEGPRL